MSDRWLPFRDSEGVRRAPVRVPAGFGGSASAADSWFDLAERTYAARLLGGAPELTAELRRASDASGSGAAAPAYALWASDNLAAISDWTGALAAAEVAITRSASEPPLVDGLDIARASRRASADLHASAGHLTEAVSTWRGLWTSGGDDHDTDGMLLAGLAAEHGGERVLARECYAAIADDARGATYSSRQLARRAAERLDAERQLAPSFAANRDAIVDALEAHDGARLDTLLSRTHFCVGLLGGHFRFEDDAFRERVIAELAQGSSPGHGAVLGSGDKRYLFCHGWSGAILNGTIALVCVRAPSGWELAGVALTELPEELAERWKPARLEKNQPLPFALKAPWPAGFSFMAGGFLEFGLKMAQVAAAAAATPFGIGGPILAEAFSLSQCGFGPRGFYYNDVSDTHQGEDAFAIDFTRYRRGVPFDNESGGTGVLAPLAGVVRTASGGRASGDASVSNTVELFHEDPETGNPARFLSRYLHLAGPNALSVSVGMPVIAGQRLGRMNDTGNSVLDHLHFSIHDQTVPSSNPSRGMSVRPTPLDGTALGDFAASTCVLSSNFERRPPPPDDAEFVRQQVPSTLRPAQPGAARFTFRNSGPTTWNPGYTLQSLAPGWTVSSVPIGRSVAPGDELTVDVSLVALTPGDFAVQWRLSRPFTGPFGQATRRVTVRVGDRDTVDCASLDRRLREAQDELRDWQDLLRTAPPSQKPGIQAQIDRVRAQIAAIETQKARAGCP
ncbi:MAG: peptidoglycan DD-metalloendopeptidase family protein [Vicinamibacterales bacterium]